MSELLIEPIGGASGNMLLGALLDLGLPREPFLEKLRALPLSPWTLEEERVNKQSLAALHVDFAIAKAQRQWSPAQILEAASHTSLAPKTSQQACSTLGKLLEVEGRVRGEILLWSDQAACDLLLDVVGFYLALELLQIGRVYSTPPPLGHGLCLHHSQLVANPNPSVAELLLNVPVRRVDLEKETVTTTGAALLSQDVCYTLPDVYQTRLIGYGAGRSDFPFSNVIRVNLISVSFHSPELHSKSERGQEPN